MQAVTARPLRDYQSSCITSTLKLATPGFRGFYTLPTGCGKTRVITGLVEHYSRMGRVLVVAHRTELIDQAAQALRDDIEDLLVGVVMAERNQFMSRCVVGSIQTLQEKRLADVLSWNDLWTDEVPPLVAVIFDECHHVTDSNSYFALISAVQEKYPECRFLGCTATPFRSDKSSMHDALPTCTFERTIVEMIEAGWLCDITWKPIKLPIDLEKVKVSMSGEGKDYNAAEVTALYSPQSEYIAARVRDMVEDRPTVVFAASVEHASQLLQALIDAGMRASMVDASTPKQIRKHLLDLWKEGVLQVMVNVGVLTEGFDYTPIAPFNEGLAAVVVARPTMSPALYLQMIGRGTRLKPGKYKDCLIVDICGNANLLATKQIMLPKAMPTVSQDEIDEFNEGQEQKRVKKTDKKDVGPYTVRINDGSEGSWLAWGCRDGVYFAEVGQNTTAVLLPDPAGSGLWYPRVITRHADYTFSWSEVVEGMIPLSECMGHINLLVAKAGNRKLLDKDALWRVGPPSEKQLRLLAKAEREQALQQNWSKGDVGHAITYKFVKSYIKRLQKLLEEGVLV